MDKTTLLLLWRNFALWEAFTKPQAFNDLKETIYALGFNPKLINQAHDDWVHEYWLWMDEIAQAEIELKIDIDFEILKLQKNRPKSIQKSLVEFK